MFNCFRISLEVLITANLRLSLELKRRPAKHLITNFSDNSRCILGIFRTMPKFRRASFNLFEIDRQHGEHFEVSSASATSKRSVILPKHVP